jgi:hypothetical protein
MDQDRFDHLVRLLGTGSSRRAAVAALAAAIPLGAAAKSGRNGPQPEGPCGDGSRRDNICEQDADCCTGICNTGPGSKNKDGKGRCRCVRKNGDCTEDKNCCGGRSCVNGICGGSLEPPCVPLGGPCSVDSNCCPSGTDKVACTQVGPVVVCTIVPA